MERTKETEEMEERLGDRTKSIVSAISSHVCSVS